MIFNEVYGVYYRTVAAILAEAALHPVTGARVKEIVEKYALGESMLTIPGALSEGRWPLLRENGSTVLSGAPDLPLTLTEKRWLKAVYADPRVRLFGDDFPDYPEAEPLFRLEDIAVFDRYADGDPYEDEGYVRRFRMILGAVREKRPLRIETRTRKGNDVRIDLLPVCLEYSEKDDKFRLIGRTRKSGRNTINLGRIRSCEVSALSEEDFAGPDDVFPAPERSTVELEVVNERNALERVLLHFAHFEKEAERIGDLRWRVSVTYDREDEAEMVIRVLSFGPLVRVTGPDRFADLIRQKLIRQKSCGQ